MVTQSYFVYINHYNSSDLCIDSTEVLITENEDESDAITRALRVFILGTVIQVGDCIRVQRG